MNRKVSAVIPTRNRPALVCRAVQSVLRQTYREIEAVVVIDGPDPETVAALEAIGDPRVRIVALPENVGGSEARNVGAREAQGEWIALLDDDDEWLPEKIEKQIAVAEKLAGPRIMVACKYLDQMGDAELVRPRKFPQRGECISDFLYGGVSWLGAMDGFPQTSTWFLSRAFLLEVPFRKGLKRNQDTDWVLQALRLPNVSLALVEEPLTIFHNEKKRKRVTSGSEWQMCRDWAIDNRELFTRHALSTYLAILPMNLAAQEGVAWGAMRSLLGDCRRYGSLSPKILWLFTLYGILYPYLRRIMAPGIRKRAVYYGSRVNSLWRFPRASRQSVLTNGEAKN
jgi:glycosyltransferase involved in cell wall biosynthesis